MQVTVSAPGKIFLMGEHTVVYGKPALLTAINKRVFVTVKTSLNSKISSSDNKFISDLTNIVKIHFNLKVLPNFDLKVNPEVKSNYHLGSSAAVAVSVIGALVYFLKKIWNPEIVNKLAYKAEQIVHGNPSGADNSAATYGGFIWYRKELEFLKNIWQIPLTINNKLNHFYLLDTGKPVESTKEMVTFVAESYKNNKKKFNDLFTLNELQTKNIAYAIKSSDRNLLIESIKIGYRTLDGIGVVSKKIFPLIKEIEREDGAAKILGGGGKTQGVGYVLCFHSNKDILQRISNKYNYPLAAIKVGEEGLRLEKGDNY